MGDVSKISPDGGTTILNIKDIEARKNVSESLLKDTVGWVGKNHIHAKLSDVKAINTVGTWSGNVYTQDGITFTVNTTSDGYVSSVIANGTNTSSGNVIFELLHDIRNEYSVGDKLILTGCPSGGSATTYGLGMRYKDYDFGNGKYIEMTSLPNNVWVGPVIFTGATVNNIIFYPMLRDASITDSTFEPYHESVDYVKANRDEVKDVIGWSGKNLLENTGVTKTESQVTFTKATDGKVAVTGTASANATFAVNLNINNLVEGSKYILSGCPKNGSASKYYLRFAQKSSASDTWGTTIATDYGDGVEITIPQNSYGFVIWIGVLSGQSTGFTYEPMLRKADIVDGTFEPYHSSVDVAKASREEMYDEIGWSSKNKICLSNDSDSVKTHNGITYTFDRVKGTLVMNGTATADSYADFKLGSIPIGEYIWNGLNGGSYTTYYIDFHNNVDNQRVARITDGEHNINIIHDTNNAYTLWANVKSGTVVNNVTVYPMLREKIIVDPTFKPYHASVKQTLRDAEVIEGKNLLNYPVGTRQVVGSDGTITDNADMYLSDFIQIDSQSVVFFAESKTGTPSCRMAFYTDAKVFISRAVDNVLPYNPSVPSNAKYVRICIEDFSSYKFINPMLCTKEEWDKSHDFEPYYIPLKDSKVPFSVQNVMGAKNLIKNTASSKTVNGITFTVNKDGTVNVNGTATERATLVLWKDYSAITDFIPAGKYIMSGCPAGGGTSESTNGYSFTIQAYGSGNKSDIGNGLQFTVPDDFTNQNYRFVIDVKKNSVCNNLVFKPMIRLADYTDDTYVPYCETNQQLTENKMSYADNGVLGAKNLLDPATFAYAGQTRTTNGITLTYIDGVVNINGTATADTDFAILSCANINSLRAIYGDMILNGCDNGRLSTYFMYLGVNNVNKFVHSGNKEVLIDANATYTLNIQVKNGTTVDNVKVYPMIRLASDPDDTYVPYCETNQQLTANKMSYADNGVLGAKNYLNKISAKISANTITVTQQDTGIRIQSASASTWGNGFFDITSLKKNTDYIISSDVAYTSGSGGINISGSTDGTNFTTITGTSSAITSSGKQTVKFNVGNYSYIRIKLFVTMGTSETADITWNNLMLRLASDPDTTYQPYAMTNRELTEFATVQESAVTDIISGASVYTDGMGNHLYKYGKVVELCLSLSSITASAFATVFKIPVGFRPRQNISLLDRENNGWSIKSNGVVENRTALTNAGTNIHATWITA